MGVNMLITPVETMGVFLCPLLGNYFKEDATMRTITELYSLTGKVYLYIGNEQAFNHFSKKAIEEGFNLPIGEDDILALNQDFSFSHTGWAGHMLFHNPDSYVDGKLIRVDYAKWISGADDYAYQ